MSDIGLKRISYPAYDHPDISSLPNSFTEAELKHLHKILSCDIEVFSLLSNINRTDRDDWKRRINQRVNRNRDILKKLEECLGYKPEWW